jgi:excinuclease UvrABC ATPase subunit
MAVAEINVYVSNMPPAHTGKEVNAIKVDEGTSEIWRFSTGLHCPESNLRYADPLPSMFSFNSAVGACETCRVLAG